MPLSRLERWGIFIVIGAVLVLPMIGDSLGIDLHVFYWVVWLPSNYVITGIATVTGVDGEMIRQLIALLVG